MAGEFSDAFALYQCQLLDKESFGDFIFYRKQTCKEFKIKDNFEQDGTELAFSHERRAFIFDFGRMFHKTK